MISLAEVREAEAPPEIAAIYEDVQRTTHLPLVNLIYRHLAILPGALPYIWSLVRPGIASGAADGALQRVVAGISLPERSTRVAQAVSGAGISALDAEAIVTILDVYNRGNLLNLVSLTAACQVLDRSDPHAHASHLDHAPVRSIVQKPMRAIPPLPKLQELPAETAALVQALALLHGNAASAGVIPSLYLHLAHWPALLASMQEPLGRFVEEGGLANARAKLLQLVRVEADALARAMATELPRPGDHHAAPMRQALEIFTRHVIPDLVPIGLLLRRAL